MEQEGGGSQQHQQNLKPLQDLATVIYLNNDQSDINFQQQYGQQLGETPATSGEEFFWKLYRARHLGICGEASLIFWELFPQFSWNWPSLYS
ncbi:hypothetical protein Patl1_33005 [Pistacia atlantica]|uniref:Uncharacterized protein n=1 Tax=Pistacia atlantica TaxID=434234 RepID=A0ACC1AQG7_9ROSI|nr:hypothetical protein Patl1_33005 [Pistacia atlantica]